MLDQLAGAGWLTHRQEPDGQVHEHVYRLTEDGAGLARRELAAGLTEAFVIVAARFGLSVDVLHGPDK